MLRVVIGSLALAGAAAIALMEERQRR